MRYCINCGNILEEGTNYCGRCGHIVNKNNSQGTVKEGRVHICPCCGSSVSSFVEKCPYCNHEFRDVHVSLAVKDFTRQLQLIESSRVNRDPRTVLVDTFTAYSGKDSIGQQKLNLIRNFAVPNTKEDIIEFIILAVGNVDEKLYRFKSNDTTIEKQLSEAWFAKAEQMVNKARIVLNDDPELEAVIEMYNKKVDACNQEFAEGKRIRNNILIFTAAFFLFLLRCCTI